MTGTPCWCLQSFRKGQLTASNVRVLECSRLRAAVSSDAANATAGLRYHASIPLYFQDHPLGAAARIMRHGDAAWRLAGGSEASLCEEGITSFNSIRAL